MTTRSNEVAVTLTGKDRLSPVLKNARKNMGRMQGSVVSMAGSMGALSTATSGVLGPTIGLVGGMGALGVVVTGVGLGLSIGINKFKAWREEQKKVSQATENLRNRLMLSGFSADAATSSVDELRGSLGRLAFQALPGLNFEMQGFIANMDAATKTRFGDLVDILVAMGVEPVAAAEAIGEALQGNFTLINKLMPGTISSSEEFSGAMKNMEVEAVIASTGVLEALKRLASGNDLSSREQVGALRTVAEAFRENEGEVSGILGRLTAAERENLSNFLESKDGQRAALILWQGSSKTILEEIIGFVEKSETAESDHTEALASEIEARIKEIEKFEPALAEEIRKAAEVYARDELALSVLRHVADIEFGRIQATQAGWVDSLGDETGRAEGFLARLEQALSRARAAAAEIRALSAAPTPVTVPRPAPTAPTGPTPVTVPRPAPTRTPAQHGAIFTHPTDVRVGEGDEVIMPLKLPGEPSQV